MHAFKSSRKSNSKATFIRLLFFCNQWHGKPRLSHNPDPFLLPPLWLTFNFLLRITLLKLSLSFNLLLLSRTMLPVSKLSNFAKGLDFEDSSTILPILNLFRSFERSRFLLIFQHLLSNCRLLLFCLLCLSLPSISLWYH